MAVGHTPCLRVAFVCPKTLAAMPSSLPDEPLDQQILELLSRQLWYRPNLPLTLRLHLTDDLGFDSLDLVELAVRLECRFRIDIHESEIGEWRRVADLVTCVAHHRTVAELLAVQPGLSSPR
jgi:acyl carrier protein